MKVEQLIELGLTKNQAKVYIELINKPQQTAGELAKTLRIDRSFMYSILKSLNDKGLVAYVTNETGRVFVASSPENILQELNEKRAIASLVIKDLQTIKQSEENSKSVNVYDGKAGMKLLVREMLKSKHFDMLAGGGFPQTLEILKYEYPHYIQELSQKNIVGRAITSKRNLSNASRLLKGSKVKIKTINKKSSQVNFIRFNDKVGIFSSYDLQTIIIKDKQISEALKIYFDILWNQIKK